MAIPQPELPQDKPKLIVDVNKNPTKKGIKVQFELPQQTPPDKKQQLQQQLQTRLNKGLAHYNLAVNLDTDVPYSNIIGFTIGIEAIKLLIKNALSGLDGSGTQAVPQPQANVSSPITPSAQQASGVPVGR